MTGTWEGPARIVLVHDDVGFAGQVTASLVATGNQVCAFENPLQALDSLKPEHQVDVLITRLSFGEGLSNGLSLAMMARNRRPTIKVLFVALEENRPYADGVGEFLALPAPVGEIVAAVDRLLRSDPPA